MRLKFGLLASLLLPAAAMTCAALPASPARAANARVSISDFKWSNGNPKIDLGESVIWTWTGPDTQHSVTGRAPNDSQFDPVETTDASQWDSDAGRAEPRHNAGDEFRVTFDHPGTYLFVCKLHSAVRGEVTVSDQPGDPDSDPGPGPKINWDGEPPTLDDWFFTRDWLNPTAPLIGPRGRGIGLRFSIGEPGTASADYYRLVRHGRGRNARTVRVFRGYTEWPAHVGINRVSFAARSKTFKPVPGNYLAYFHAEDRAANPTTDIPLRFMITGNRH